MTFASPTAAKGAATELRAEFNGAESMDKKLRVARVATRAANEAKASAERTNLTSAEKNKLLKVSEVYAGLKADLFRDYNAAKEVAAGVSAPEAPPAAEGTPKKRSLKGFFKRTQSRKGAVVLERQLRAERAASKDYYDHAMDPALGEKAREGELERAKEEAHHADELIKELEEIYHKGDG